MGFLHFTSGQTVDSIRVEQSGDLVKIYYKILGSNEYQTFRITVYCSINSGLKAELKSLSGDFGDKVTGGRDEYLVLWDVLKDVDEISSAEFSVKAELLIDETPKVSKKKNMRSGGFYVLAEGELPQPGFGARIGYMGSWGISVMFIKGMASETHEIRNLDVPDFVACFDLAVRIVKKDNFNLHLYGGVNTSVYPEYYNEAEGSYWKDDFFGVNGGLICNFNALALSAGFGTLQNFEPSVYIGIGLRF